MSWLIKTFSSSIGQKIIMALTGLFLCTFLVVHLLGNFQLLYDDGGYKFNAYTKFMTSNPLIKIASYVTYFAILYHAFQGLWLAYKNQSARPKGYKKHPGNATSTWSSRNMGVLGTIILVFIVVHMQQFWYEYKFTKKVTTEDYILYEGETEPGVQKILTRTQMKIMDSTMQLIQAKYISPDQQGFDQEGFMKDPEFKKYETIYKDLEYAPKNGKIKVETYKDLYIVVQQTFKDTRYVLLYLLSMIAISFHLWHGFRSAFQSMAWKHPKYNGLINALGYFFAFVIPAGFAAIPLIIYFS